MRKVEQIWSWPLFIKSVKGANRMAYYLGKFAIQDGIKIKNG